MIRGSWRKTCRIGKVIVSGRNMPPGNGFSVPFMGNKGIWYDKYKMTGAREMESGETMYRYELLEPGANTSR